MKIAIINERVNVELGGAERSLFELSSALRSVRLQVDIIAAKGNATSKNIHFLCNDTAGKRTPFSEFEKSVKAFLGKNQYDIVHSFLPIDCADIYQPRGGSYPEAIIRNAASYQSSLTSFFKKTTSFMNSKRAQLLRAERRICVDPKGPIVAALSDYVADQFKRHYDLPQDRLAVIRNGVLTDKIPDIVEVDKFRASLLKQFSLKEADQPVFFLFAAHNFRLKGLAPLIQAMQLAAANEKQKAYLIVAGAGQKQKYRKLAVKYNIADRILFIDSVKKIHITIAACDVAILPTYYDPSSRFTIEALAAQKPVITTRFNGATDLFTNNRHGKIIDIPENIPALGKAINYFTDTYHINKAATAIRNDRLKDNISISRAVRELTKLYDAIMESKNK